MSTDGPKTTNSLADAFGPAALSGLLARRTTAAPATEAPPAGKEASPGETRTDGATTTADESGAPSVDSSVTGDEQTDRVRGPAAAGPARARKTTPGRKRQPPTVDQGADQDAIEDQVEDGITSQVSVYLDADALLAVRKTRRATGQTNADIAFAAIDATHDRLADLVAARRRGAARPAGSLFPTRQTTRLGADRSRRVVLWAMRATRTELAVIDRLVDQVAAGSRSELIAAAVEAQLLGDPDRRQR